MSRTLQNKFHKITLFLLSDENLASDENLLNEVIGLKEYLESFQNLDLPSDFLQAMAKQDRFSLEFGGDTKTARQLERWGQVLASEGFIREPETLSDLEDLLVDLYQTYKTQKLEFEKYQNAFNSLYELAKQATFKAPRKLMKLIKFYLIQLVKLEVTQNLISYIRRQFKGFKKAVFTIKSILKGRLRALNTNSPP